MFAVIKTGGKQYRVAAEDVIEIERVAGEGPRMATTKASPPRVTRAPEASLA